MNKMNLGYKVCRKCMVEKPLSELVKGNSSKNGRQNLCKNCKNAARRVNTRDHRNCTYCGNQFKPHRKLQTECSHSCHSRMMYSKTYIKKDYANKICPECKTHFKPRHKNHLFCSYDCGERKSSTRRYRTKSEYREKVLKQMKTYRGTLKYQIAFKNRLKKNGTKIRDQHNTRCRKYNNEMPDWYVIGLLKKSSELSAYPNEIINLKRAHLKLKRSIKQS